ncbi:MAG: glycoside hydrolase family 3 C-terminal domain-containing protein [Clostridiales bacterium]|nr:glycoside hydrolase family 3 C-terminal domain-containing protein [Clostridiales bacterium]
MEKWTRANYQPNLPLGESGRVTASAEHIALSREAASEGMVLIKNENKLLPFGKGTRLALFGKASADYVKIGGGSGDVETPYAHGLYDGLMMQDGFVSVYEPLMDFYRGEVGRQYAEGVSAGMTAEPDVPDELLEGAADFADAAVIVINRFSGEGWDRSDVEYHEGCLDDWIEEPRPSMPKRFAEVFPDGDFCLTEGERRMVARVKNKFVQIAVVLNIGGMMDLSWIKDDPAISSALIAWQPGMEGGTAMADILCGKANPSGKLCDTFAGKLTDYPSTEGFFESMQYVNYTEDIYVGYRYFETIPGADKAVVYPFGFGLSYTEFSISAGALKEDGDVISVDVSVKNIGEAPGKEVAQLYVSAPQGKLGKPSRALIAFHKTKLLMPGESEEFTLSAKKRDFASYDDLGKIKKSAYVLEAGDYEFHVGNSVRDAKKIDGKFTVKEDMIAEQLSEKLIPQALPKRMLSDGTYEALPQSEPLDLDECAFEKLPVGMEALLAPAGHVRETWRVSMPYKKGAKTLRDVADGKATLDDFIEQLSDDELLSLLGGQPNTGVANTFGIGNLPEYGVPSVMTADGPAGLRLERPCGVKTTAWPCATLLACTWDPEVVERVGRAAAMEVKENNISIWLAPAVNIHRNPLCGRNFEYYSEDPCLAGKIGAAMVRGIQSQHVAATVKHFVANNKETNRTNSDSRMSERALREIYLRPFEIIVKEADPWALMSSYNAINGHRTSECRELLTDILRGEWGFEGMVTTDWWNLAEHYKEILAGNDVKMPTGFPDRVKRAHELGVIGRADLESCAARVLGLILKID